MTITTVADLVAALDAFVERYPGALMASKCASHNDAEHQVSRWTFIWPHRAGLLIAHYMPSATVSHRYEFELPGATAYVYENGTARYKTATRTTDCPPSEIAELTRMANDVAPWPAIGAAWVWTQVGGSVEAVIRTLLGPDSRPRFEVLVRANSGQAHELAKQLSAMSPKMLWGLRDTGLLAPATRELMGAVSLAIGGRIWEVDRSDLDPAVVLWAGESALDLHIGVPQVLGLPDVSAHIAPRAIFMDISDIGMFGGNPAIALGNRLNSEAIRDLARIDKARPWGTELEHAVAYVLGPHGEDPIVNEARG